MKSICNDRLCRIVYMSDFVLDMLMIYEYESKVFTSRSAEAQKLQQAYNYIRRGRMILDEVLNCEGGEKNEE